uniref:Uncharacterized protein n=1 Tax=Arundo donax TaxID=35708 RepID=A0A0A9F1D8_ARUDO
MSSAFLRCSSSFWGCDYKERGSSGVIRGLNPCRGGGSRHACPSSSRRRGEWCRVGWDARCRLARGWLYLI